MFTKKALVLIGVLFATEVLTEEPVMAPPEISIDSITNIGIYSSDEFNLPIYICQDEAVAREILYSWHKYGEAARYLLMGFASATPGERISIMRDCEYYQDYMVPLRYLDNWPSLPDSSEGSAGTVSITLTEMEIYVYFLDQSFTVYGLLPDKAVASR